MTPPIAPNANGPKYRTFVSYFSEDKAEKKLVVSALKALNHNVWHDKRNVRPGITIAEQVQRGIERSHFLVSVLTEQAWRRPWVQHEIGYAMRSGLGVLPIVFGKATKLEGMLGGIAAIFLDRGKGKEAVRKKLRRVKWDQLLDDAIKRAKPVFHCNYAEARRGHEIADSADAVRKKWRVAKVMQQSPMTSFSLPDAHADRHWVQLINVPNKANPPWFQPEERIALQELIEEVGCDLIIDPCYSRDDYLVDVQVAKLKTLLDFLKGLAKSPLKKQVRVVLKKFDSAESETIIEDHWMVHSAGVARCRTRRESVSTWHAPTVREYSEQFRAEFNRLFTNQASLRGNTAPVDFAIKVIEQALARLASRPKQKVIPPRPATCRFQCGCGGQCP